MMKKLLLAITILTSTLSFSQARTYIPDDAFEQGLINIGLDDVLDDYVDTFRIENRETLDIGTSIADATGIEDFVALKSLDFSFNNLATIDLSNNVNLEFVDLSNNQITTIANTSISSLSKLRILYLTNNQLTELNFSNNENLEELYLGGNSLTTIDVCSNNKLERLILRFNNLNTLDISCNPTINNLDCYSNSLTSLNIANGNNVGFFIDTRLNPDLYCVQVDDAEYSLDNWLTGIRKDEQTGYSIDCTETTTIPDSNFEQALIDLGHVPGPLDGQIFTGNVSAVKNLFVSNKNISDMSGVEVFHRLEVFSCRNNNLTTLNLSNLGINTLEISGNPLTDLDISTNTNLEYLICENNELINLDVSNNLLLINIIANQNNLTTLSLTNNLALDRLELAENQITDLNVSNNINLTELNVSSNMLTSIDLSSNVLLESIELNNNNLSSINIQNGNNEEIFRFRLFDNPNLTCVQVDDVDFAIDVFDDLEGQVTFSLDCSATSENTVTIPDSNFEQALIDQNIDSDGVLNGQVLASDIDTIEFLDVNSENISDLTGIEGFTALETLMVYNNNLATIDVSENLELSGLVAAINNLSSIDVSQNLKLVSLSLNQNNITSIDLSNNIDIKQIYMDDNQLSAINVEPLLRLEELSVSNNNLTEIKVNANLELRILNCSLNQISILNTFSNAKLESLNCERNSIEYLDLSQNPSLTILACNDNALLGLNIKNGTNTNIINSNFSAFANLGLTCIEVDDVSYSNNNWAQIDMQTNFSTSCTPVNDDCSYTIPIILGQDTPGNTSTASGSANNPNCLPSGLTAFDVWYSFPAPASGSVTMTINAPPLVGRVALYSSCGDAQPLYCGINELVVNGLIPNGTYYLQVWLELDLTSKSNTTSKSLNESGLFTLNVQDSSVLSTKDIVNSEFDFNIYPNPAKDFVTVKTSNAINSIEFFTLSGQKVLYKSRISNTKNTIDVRSLNSGIYLLKINSETKSYIRKLIIK